MDSHRKKEIALKIKIKCNTNNKTPKADIRVQPENQKNNLVQSQRNLNSTQAV